MLAAGEREAVAYHEAGHVLCAELCPTVDKTLHATINPRGQAAGFAVVGRSDRALHTAQHIHEQLIYILGGRAAEHVDLRRPSPPAPPTTSRRPTASPAPRSSSTACPPPSARSSPPGAGFSEQTKATVDGEVRRIVEEAYRDAIAHGRGAPRAARAPHPGAAGRGRHRPPRDRRRDGGLHASPPAARTCSRCPTPSRTSSPTSTPERAAPARPLGPRPRRAPAPRSRRSAPSATPHAAASARA